MTNTASTDQCPHLINGGTTWGTMRCALPAGHTDSDQPWDHAYSPTREHCDMLRAGITSDKYGRIHTVGEQPVKEWQANYHHPQSR